MFDHPQDAYRLEKDRNFEIRQSVEYDRLVRDKRNQSGNNQPATGREWLEALANLRKIRIEVKLIVQEPQPKAGC